MSLASYRAGGILSGRLAFKISNKLFRLIPTCNKKHPPIRKDPPRQQTSPATKNILRHKIDQTISRGVFFIGGVSRTPPLIKSFEKDPLVSILPLLCIFLSSSLPLSLSSPLSLLLLSYLFLLSLRFMSLSPRSLSSFLSIILSNICKMSTFELFDNLLSLSLKSGGCLAPPASR